MAYIRPANAIISLSDKSGLSELSEGLIRHGINIFSTGGTAAVLKNLDCPVTDISTYTKSPEIMNGRLKTLHPKIHGGLLGRRDKDNAVMLENEIEGIDLLFVNFYPFERVLEQHSEDFEKIIESIDIGGPAMVRSAAKNFSSVGVVVDTNDYELIVEQLDKNSGKISFETRLYLAKKAFTHISGYDAAISNFFSSANWREESLEEFPETITVQHVDGLIMRYGENPHQKACFYKEKNPPEGSISKARKKQGKDLSFNNISDSDVAWACVSALLKPACVIVKHGNPCGVAQSSDLVSSYRMAYSTDPSSAFGGIVSFNRRVNEDLAKLLLEQQFLEVLLAPSFSEEAMDVLATKENVRVLELPTLVLDRKLLDYRKVAGGLLVQELDQSEDLAKNFELVTNIAPSDSQHEDLSLAWNVSKFVKSNAIVLTNGGMTYGIGAGQTSRVMSLRVAIMKAADEGLSLKSSCLASDAFFPFRDSVDIAAKAGIGAIIQPGGSLRDEEVIRAANEAGIAMLLTGKRHFRH